MDKTTTSSY